MNMEKEVGQEPCEESRRMQRLTVSLPFPEELSTQTTRNQARNALKRESGWKNALVRVATTELEAGRTCERWEGSRMSKSPLLLQAVDVVEHDGPNPMGILGNLTFQKVHRRAAGASASSTPSRAASRSEIWAYKSRQAEAGAAIPQRADFRFWPKGGDWASAGVEHGTVRSAPHPTCRDWTGPTTNKLKSQQPTTADRRSRVRGAPAMDLPYSKSLVWQGKAHSMGEVSGIKRTPCPE
ncbi:hypothetical protein FDECE_12887 [Fusarium decemcellulare]|nr:hypothetical protein FDECE_12887 [Fusarium decemcellulare]